MEGALIYGTAMAQANANCSRTGLEGRPTTYRRQPHLADPAPWRGLDIA